MTLIDVIEHISLRQVPKFGLRTEFAAALNQLASEKGIDVNTVVEAIEQAALAAYRKDLSLP